MYNEKFLHAVYFLIDKKKEFIMFDYLFEIAKNTECAQKHFEKDLAYHVGPYELNHLIHAHIEKINLVDVRDYEDYLDGHIPFAMHVPAGALEENLSLFEKNKLMQNTHLNKYQKLK